MVYIKTQIYKLYFILSISKTRKNIFVFLPKKNVIFVPAAPKDVEESIDQMLIAFYEANHNPNINPLLLISCFILDFLCVHPFDDGNGRMSRLLTLLLLYKSGFDIGRFISIENMINENKGEYYRTLQESSTNWQDGKNTYEPFMLYMIQILYECYIKLDENVFSQIDKKLSKTERIEKLLLNAFVPISKRTIQDQLPDISEQLIEMVLSKLIKEDKIVKIGSYKDAIYYRK
jgi:Fic family protein